PTLDPDHMALIEVGECLALEPLPIGDKFLQGQRLGQRPALACLIAIQRQGALRIRNMRARPRGSRPHTPWHLAIPDVHRLAKDPPLPPGGPQMSRHCHAVRPGSNHCELTTPIPIAHQSLLIEVSYFAPAAPSTII